MNKLQIRKKKKEVKNRSHYLRINLSFFILLLGHGYFIILIKMKLFFSIYRGILFIGDVTRNNYHKQTYIVQIQTHWPHTYVAQIVNSPRIKPKTEVNKASHFELKSY